jgi:catechol 2,3-dioxygenase-like lactoylglutathione lyase family enzyme
MLSQHVPIPTLAVADLERARSFYEGTLGFVPAREVPDGVMYGAGASSFFVYPSAYAGTNKATAMSFQVPQDAFDAEVGALRDAGLDFQTFELEGMEWQDGVAVAGSMRAVWFSDPDGNILNVETA